MRPTNKHRLPFILGWHVIPVLHPIISNSRHYHSLEAARPPLFLVEFIRRVPVKTQSIAKLAVDHGTPR
jgi:hypothetical protein